MNCFENFTVNKDLKKYNLWSQNKKNLIFRKKFLPSFYEVEPIEEKEIMNKLAKQNPKNRIKIANYQI